MLTQQPTKQHSTNQTTKQQKNLLFRSFIRNSELRSKLLAFDKSKSKTSFYLDLCSLIRNFDLKL